MYIFLNHTEIPIRLSHVNDMNSVGSLMVICSIQMRTNVHPGGAVILVLLVWSSVVKIYTFRWLKNQRARAFELDDP